MKEKERLLLILSCLSALTAAVLLVLYLGTREKTGEESPQGAVLVWKDQAASEAGTLREEKPRKPVNLLLIGQDRKPEEPGTRSDSILLCTVAPEAGTITLTSILRDLYVKIPGYADNRINAAYSFGGAELLRQTLRNNLGVRVDGTVEVDFEQFAGLVDLLGGVPMDLREDEAKLINRALPGSELREGTCILTGQQALTYSRIRSLDPDADVSRSRRQRKVLEKIFNQYHNASPLQLAELLRQAIPMMTTDLSAGEIIALAADILPQLRQIRYVSRRIPADGTYRDRMIRNMAVLEADLEKNSRILSEIQSGEPEK